MFSNRSPFPQKWKEETFKYGANDEERSIMEGTQGRHIFVENEKKNAFFQLQILYDAFLRSKTKLKLGKNVILFSSPKYSSYNHAKFQNKF